MKSIDVKNIYDGNYFLKQVDGFAEFEKFDGTLKTMTDRYQRNINLLRLENNHKLLEVGCGRGEVCMYHVKNGGSAIGVDYSSDAIEIARNKARMLKIAVDFINCSFHEIEEPENSYDRILASEFIEHISREEGIDFLKSAYKILKPGGKLLIFTYPNTLFRKYGYPIYRIFSLLLGRRLPKVMPDTLTEHYRSYHLNEQNFRSLNSMVKIAGFKKYVINYDVDLVNRDSNVKSFIFRLISATPLRHIFFCNLYVLAEK